MGNLVLVRHGQALPFEKESDKLSAIGEAQARALGSFWIREQVGFDEIYCGALIRQKRTAEIVGECFAARGLGWPEVQSSAELNEYDADGLISKLIPAMAERDAAFREMVAAFEQNRQSPERNRYFQKMFEAVTSVWLIGEMELTGVESWAAFSQRIREELKRIVKLEGSGRRVAIFTSGGVIGCAVQSALEAPEAKALEINWRVRNCSLTEFTFSRGRLSFDSFNAIPHLDDPKLRTFR